MTARSSSSKFGRCVDLVSGNAPEESEFRVAAESMVGHTGRLVTDHEIDSEGRGTSFRAGDLLFSKLRPYLAKSWVANRDGEALGDIHVYRPVDEMCSRYLGYLVLSSFFLEQVNASTYGTKMPRANWDFIKTIEIWAPDFDTQRRIADYLDRETATIDALIEKQAVLIAGARERRRALVEHAVIGAGAPQRRLGWCLSTRSGDVPTTDLEGTIPVYGAGRLLGWSHFSNAKAGELVVGRVGSVGSLRLLSEAAWVSDNAIVCTWDVTQLEPRYGYYAMTLIDMSELSSGTAMPLLTATKLKKRCISVPPLEEQREIADHLDRETAKINALIAKAERFIELAQERRAALITAAVTGQIEIPTED